MITECYSTAGPICPHCDHQHQADDPSYYNEDMDRMDCDHCCKEFLVRVYTSTSWTTGKDEL